MVFIDLHYEHPEEIDSLETLLKKGVPFALSIVPTQSVAYPSYVHTLLRESAKRKNVIIGQQGKTHWCMHTKEHETARADPCHENFCFYFPIKKEEQQAIMSGGMNILAEFLQRKPDLYVPPNHMYNEDTVKLADELGYKFFADNGIVLHLPYKRFGLIVMPELKADSKPVVLPKEKSGACSMIYFHNNNTPKNFAEIIDRAENFNDMRNYLPPSEDADAAFVDFSLSLANTFIKNSYKRLRDFKRRIRNINDYRYETSPAVAHAAE